MKLNITKLVRALIKAAKAADDRIPKGILSIQSRAREYGTIKLHAHRQAGHSLAIDNLATENSLVLAMNMRHAEHHTLSLGMVCTYRSNFVKKMRGIALDMIFIDNASYCQVGPLKKLYDPTFLKSTFGDRLPILIFLG